MEQRNLHPSTPVSNGPWNDDARRSAVYLLMSNVADGRHSQGYQTFKAVLDACYSHGVFETEEYKKLKDFHVLTHVDGPLSSVTATWILGEMFTLLGAKAKSYLDLD